MRILGIITARSGSKGLKNKNIKEIEGKPLIAYTIEAAIQSRVFDTVMVSTDSQQYSDIAIRYNAEVPFLRSEKTSSDEATTKEVIEEVLQKYSKKGEEFTHIAILQPTSPLRTAEDIAQAWELFQRKKAKGVVGVCEMDHSPLWCNTLPKDRCLEGFLKEGSNGLRQNLDIYYRVNGAIYIYAKEFYLTNKNLYDKECFAYVMARDHSIDIDTQLDFEIAQVLMKRK